MGKTILISLVVLTALNGAYALGKHDGWKSAQQKVELFVEGYAASACGRYEARRP